jgi:hypothetical protein
MAKKVRTHRLNGELYHIDVEGGFNGLCDSPRERGHSLHIRVACDINTKQGLQALIGECLHPENWAQTEEVTHRAGDEIGALLYRLLRSGQIKIEAKGE